MSSLELQGDVHGCHVAAGFLTIFVLLLSDFRMRNYVLMPLSPYTPLKCKNGGSWPTANLLNCRAYILSEVMVGWLCGIS